MTESSNNEANESDGGQERQKPPTIADVAQSANVSVGTASHVLSGNRNVSPETRARVEEAIDELGFRPNRLARMLSTDRTFGLGMVVPDVSNPFFAKLIRGVEDILHRKDLALLLGNSDNDPDKERRYLEVFLERRLDGLILVSAGETDLDLLERFSYRGPVVLVDRSITEWTGDLVRGDSEKGVRLAVEHLAELGHQRIGMISGDLCLSTGTKRQDAFWDATRELGLSGVAGSGGLFTMASGAEQAEELLGVGNPPTALCAANDLLALGALRKFQERQVRVPAELSIVGYDDIAYAAIASPALTTVRQPAYEMGASASRVAIQRLRGLDESAQTVTVEPTLVVRQSTAKPPR